MLGACAPAFTMVVLMVVLSLIYWLFELFAKTLLERMGRFLKNAGVTFTFEKKRSFCTSSVLCGQRVCFIQKLIQNGIINVKQCPTADCRHWNKGTASRTI